MTPITRSHKRDLSQACQLMDLPLEIIYVIVDQLASMTGQRDLKSLSCTNRYYRGLLVGYVFRSIVLRNTKESGHALSALSKSEIIDHVRHLRYIGSVPPIPDRDGLDIRAPNPIPFPAEVESMLSDLGQFPNMQSISMEFAFEWDDFADPYEHLDGAETLEDVQKAEIENGWRVLMVQSFGALAKNRSFNYHLQIHELPPYTVSTFETESFHALLRQLAAFTLTLKPWDNGAGWQLNTMEELMNGFARKLDKWFFNHLDSVTDFSLEATDMAPLGLTPGRNQVYLALNKQQLPQLRSIRVRYMFLCPQLQDLLVARADTLEEIELHDCMANLSPMDEDTLGIPWCDFLNALADAKPSKLRALKVHWTEELEFSDRMMDVEATKEEVEGKTKKIQRMLEDDPSIPMFNYTTLDDKYGMIFQDETLNRNRYLRGDDQDAFKRLMNIVKESEE